MGVTTKIILSIICIVRLCTHQAGAAVSFTFLPTTTSIPETSLPGTTVHTLSPTGGTTPYTCSVSLQNPYDSDRQFAFNGLAIETVLGFDFENTTTYILTVECVDSAVVTGTTSLTVKILDINDEPPVIGGTLSGLVNEELSPGTVVSGLFTATDADNGDVLSYSLTGSDTTYFQIDSSSGTVTVKRRLDRDAVAARLVFDQLTLTVADAASASAAATLTITLVDINDNTPTFSPSVYYVTVPENTPSGVNLVTVTCTDPDQTPGNGDITYVIQSGDDVTPKFSIVGNDLQTSNNSIEYESLSGQSYRYQIVVTGTDGGTVPNTGTATIIIQVSGENDADPVWDVFTPSYVDSTTPYDIREDVPIGTTVLTIQATDNDDGADGVVTLTLLSIVNDVGISSLGMFVIDTVTGSLVTNENLERDNSASAYYDLVIRATDQGSPPRSVDRSLRVGILDVNDNPPIFAQELYEVTRPENEAVGALVLTLVVTDSDNINSTLSFAIQSGNTDAKFQIAGNNLEIQTIIDLDVPNSDSAYYTLVISASDGGAPELTGSTTVIVTVSQMNEFNPAFQPASFGPTISITGGTGVGSTLLTITASDDDYGTDGLVSYSITSGDPSGTFQLNSQSGVLKLVRQLDYDTLASSPLELTVVAADGGGRTNTSTVTVSVSDVADLKPSCSSNVLYVSVPEDQAVGSVVYTLVCNSVDVSGNLTYLITSGNNGNAFNISSSGELQVQNGLDQDSGSVVYNLVVHVSDEAGTEIVLLTVILLPVNEAPVFVVNTVNITWSEDTAIGTVLGSVSATDPDTGSQTGVTYSISNVIPSMNVPCRIDSSRGELQLIQELDADVLTEAFPYMMLIILATDGGGLQGTATVNVFINDANDNTPSCHSPLEVLYTPESSPGDIFPVVIAASLPCGDPDPDAVLTYEIPPNSYGPLFLVDSETGMINISSAVDYEGLNWYSFPVIVNDGGIPLPKSVSLTVNVIITNVNDGPPVYPGVLSVTIPESATIGEFVMDARASDPDDSTTPEGTLLYSFISGDPNKHFSISEITGIVTVNKELDRELISSYQITVQAMEMVGTFNTTTTIDISLSDENDNSPICPQQLTRAVVSENAAVGTLILPLSCTDADSDLANSILVYTISTGDTTKFQITATNLTLKATIDYEAGITSYDLNVTAFDGLNNQNMEITVIISPVNEHNPAFTNTGSPIVVQEHTSPGTPVFQITANDADDGLDGTIQYTMAAQPNFILDQQTGELILTDYLDRENKTQYTLIVTATDLGVPPRNTTTTVTITLLDVNDHSPVFSPGSYSLVLPQNTGTGSTILALNCSDEDEGVNADITFDIVSGNFGDTFRVQPVIPSSDCELIVNNVTNLNYDQYTAFQLLIRASDGGGRTTDALVQIQIIGYNDFAPVFVPVSSSDEYIYENLTVGSTIVDLNATDADMGPDGEVLYSISNSEAFTVESSTGTVMLTAVLDREMEPFYMLEILAVDRGSNPSSKTATYTLNIYIQDVNDISPACTQTSYSFSVSENTAPFSLLGELICSDLDTDSPNNNMIFSISNSTVAGLFNLESSTGKLYSTNGSSFDREVISNMHLSITVADQGLPSLETEVTVDILVTDENDNAPQFCCPPYASSVPLGVATGTSIFQFNATDADEPPYGTVSYSIMSGNINNAFTIEAQTGIVRVQTLEGSSVTSYNLSVIASDLGNPPLTAVGMLLVDVGVSYPPLCTSLLYYGTVLENVSVSDYVLNISCSDSDIGDVIVFSLEPTTAPFAIDTTSGILTVVSPLDAEAVSTYTMRVNVSDGLFTRFVTVTVDVEDVNEAPPAFDLAGLYTVLVSEQEAVGTVLTVANATDPDISNATFFSITGGNTNNSFRINTYSGSIRLNDVLDYETLPIYELVVTVSDGFDITSMSASITFTVSLIDANDNPPVCNPDVYAIIVNETDTGTVTNIPCVDYDTISTNLTYWISSGNTNNDFIINVNTGELSISASLRYDNITFYDIIVEVTDGTLSTEVYILISVLNSNVHVPVFSSPTYSASIDEDTAPGASVVSALATDVDGSIFYSIVSGNEDLKFNIDATSGLVRLAARLDREQMGSYNLTLRASDRPPSHPDVRSSDANLSVIVRDVNDNHPVFTSNYFSVSVTETEAGGTSLVGLLASDADEGPNAIITYSIVGGNSAGLFDVIGNDVSIKAGQTLDYETQTNHHLTVMAADSGSNTMSSLAIVSVQVLPANEFIPTFAGNASVTVAEDTPIGTVLYTATAVDYDSGTHGAVVYTLVAGSTLFVDAISGEVKVWSEMDFDLGTGTYTAEIMAHDMDGNSSGLSSSMTLSVVLTDVNDIVPTFAQVNYTFTITENSPPDSYVGIVVASDNESADNGVVSYASISGNMEDFTVNTATGEIRTGLNKFIDYEVMKDYFLGIRATDSGVPPLSSFCLVHVSVIDANDIKPYFESGNFTIYVNEDTPSGTSIFTLTALDEDTFSVSFIYTVSPPTPCSNDATGVLTILSPLDRETETQHVLTVTADDQGSPRLTGTCSVTVIILDVNDNAPVFVGPIGSHTVTEDTRPGTAALTLTATDADQSQNGELVFTITSGNANNDWSLEETTGRLLIAKALDRETQDVYDLVVMISDIGIPSNNISVTISITIEDVNEFAPVFSLSNYNFSAAENISVGTLVGNLVAFDNDTGMNAALQYYLVEFLTYVSTLEFGKPVTKAGTTERLPFTIDLYTGNIVSADTLDREAVGKYSFVCRVQDSGSPAFSVDVPVAVNVLDVNDVAPRFRKSHYTWILSESVPAGGEYLLLAATDPDRHEDNRRCKMLFDDSHPNATLAKQYFNVGFLYVITKVAVDRATHSGLSFGILITNSRYPFWPGTTNVTVIVDTNFNNPVFPQTFLNEAVAYDARCQDLITTVSATDADLGLPGTVYYSLLIGPSYLLFTVGRETGEVRPRGTLKKGKTYVLYIAATDNGARPRSALTNLTLRIDAFDPGDVSIAFPLSVSRSYMAAHKDNFMSHITDTYRKKYPNAIVKLWCIEERNEYVEDPAARRRRVIPARDKAVTFHVYIVPDNTTDSIDNFYTAKTFVSASDAIAFVTDGNPGATLLSAITDSNWTNYGLVGVELSRPVQDTFSDLSAIVVSSVLSLLLVISLIVILLKCYDIRRERPEQSATQEVSNAPKRTRATDGEAPQLADEVSIRPTQTEEGRRRSREPIDHRNTKVDPVTGKLFQYDKTAGIMRWLSTRDGKPLDVQKLQEIRRKRGTTKKTKPSSRELF